MSPKKSGQGYVYHCVAQQSVNIRVGNLFKTASCVIIDLLSSRWSVIYSFD